MRKNYPTCSYEPDAIRAWYRTLKNNCICPACQIMQPSSTFIEFHHLDRQTKIDTLSNMVYLLAPMPVIMAETFKVMPLCHDHHVRYHRLERHGHTDLINKLYNFKNDSHYTTAIGNFHDMAWNTAPKIMQDSFVENEFEICHRNLKPIITPSLPNGALR